MQIPGSPTDRDVIQYHLDNHAPGFKVVDVLHDVRQRRLLATSTNGDNLRLQTVYTETHLLTDFRLTAKDA